MCAFDLRSCQLIMEEQTLQNPRQVKDETEMNECRKLQVNSEFICAKTVCRIL